jgi:hypothetical protein
LVCPFSAILRIDSVLQICYYYKHKVLIDQFAPNKKRRGCLTNPAPGSKENQMSVSMITHQRRNFVPALSDFDLGRQMFRTGKRLSQCNSDEAARGWLAAEAAGAQAYLRVMESEGVPHHVALAGLDALTAPGWRSDYAIENDYEDIRRGN